MSLLYATVDMAQLESVIRLANTRTPEGTLDTSQLVIVANCVLHAVAVDG